MKIGTKSILFGAHCFLLHPWFVALAWRRLYGSKRVVLCTDADCSRCAYRTTHILDPRLWLAFVVHDLGYWGKPNMDGSEGEQHPRLGARILSAVGGVEWHNFVLYHSRFLARQEGHRPSLFCIADKLATVLTPAWLYIPMVRATGEVEEYMAKSSSRNEKYFGMNLDTESIRAWHSSMIDYMTRWIEEHKDGRADTWTPKAVEP